MREEIEKAIARRISHVYPANVHHHMTRISRIKLIKQFRKYINSFINASVILISYEI
jgi:hypothetical protein